MPAEKLACGLNFTQVGNLGFFWEMSGYFWSLLRMFTKLQLTKLLGNASALMLSVCS